MGGTLIPIEKSVEFNWFIEPARHHFDFLVAKNGFECLGVIHEPRLEFGLIYQRSSLCVCPLVSESFVTTVIGVFDPRADRWPTGKAMHILERIRCPENRLLPDERDRFKEGTLDSVFAHDADVLRAHFPDVLDGRLDYLMVEHLPEDWRVGMAEQPDDV